MPARINRLKEQYAETGIRRSVDAVMIVTVSCSEPSLSLARAHAGLGRVEANDCDRIMASHTSSPSKSAMPSINCELVSSLQYCDKHSLPEMDDLLGRSKAECPLRPGGYLDPSETDEQGLITRLNEQLGVPASNGGYMSSGGKGDWMIGECLSTWWRPNFDTFLVSFIPDIIWFSHCSSDAIANGRRRRS